MSATVEILSYVLFVSDVTCQTIYLLDAYVHLVGDVEHVSVVFLSFFLHEVHCWVCSHDGSDEERIIVGSDLAVWDIIAYEGLSCYSYLMNRLF